MCIISLFRLLLSITTMIMLWIITNIPKIRSFRKTPRCSLATHHGTKLLHSPINNMKSHYYHNYLSVQYPKLLISQNFLTRTLGYEDMQQTSIISFL